MRGKNLFVAACIYRKIFLHLLRKFFFHKMSQADVPGRCISHCYCGLWQEISWYFCAGISQLHLLDLSTTSGDMDLEKGGCFLDERSHMKRWHCLPLLRSIATFMLSLLLNIPGWFFTGRHLSRDILSCDYFYSRFILVSEFSR